MDLLTEEASKITLGQALEVFTSHQMSILLALDGPHWMTESRILKYQVPLLENPDITIQRCTTLNPATLLPCLEEGAPIHNDKGSMSLVILDEIIGCAKFAKRYLLERKYTKQSNSYVMPVHFVPIITLKKVSHPCLYNQSNIKEASYP